MACTRVWTGCKMLCTGRNKTIAIVASRSLPRRRGSVWREIRMWARTSIVLAMEVLALTQTRHRQQTPRSLRRRSSRSRLGSMLQQISARDAERVSATVAMSSLFPIEMCSVAQPCAVGRVAFVQLSEFAVWFWLSALVQSVGST
mmetsp:Transcript_94756/g.306421  ORF Transcript_94756/g.306421 Transcript_94756/m.306421 type:complete len:145 (-) Transcript_94756:10-444(-)